MNNLTRPHFALRITLIYAVLSGLWILLTDRVVVSLVTDVDQLQAWEIWKGWIYTGVIAIILYALLRRESQWHARAEATLQQAEAQYRQLFEALPVPCWVYDAKQLTMQMVNSAAVRHYGYSPEEFLALKIQDLHPAEDVALLLDYHAWLTQGNLPSSASRDTVWCQHKKDGTPLEVELTWSLLTERQAVLVAAYDVTERRQVESQKEAALEALRRQERDYRSLAENIPDIVARFDRQMRCIFVNRHVEAASGLPVSTFLGKTLREFSQSPEAADLGEKMFAQVIESGQVQTQVVAVPALNGLAYFEQRLIPEFGSDGTVETILSIDRDISQRKQAEDQREAALAAVWESEKRFSTIFQYAPLAIAIMRLRDNQFVELNNEAQRLTRFTREQVVGRTPVDLQLWFDPEDQKRLAQLIGEQREVHDQEFHLRHPSGAIVTLSLSAQFIDLADERCLLVMAQDITDRKQAEAALRASEERFRRALENVPDVIVIYDPDLRIRYINGATRQLTGRPSDGYLGRRDDEVWPPEIYETYLPTLRRALETGETCTVVVELALPDSGNRNVQITCVPLPDESGLVREVLGITHDFTERQQAAEALSQYAERLKVVHEVGRASLAGQLPQNIAELTLKLLLQIVPYQRGTITWISSHTQEAVGVTQVNDRLASARRDRSPAGSATDQRLAINIPLYSRSALIGTVNLQADRLAPFTKQDVEIVREASDELALALQHAQLFEQVRTGRDRMELLSRRLLDVQETERRAIARELHDEIGQALTAVKIDLQGLQRSSPSETVEQLNDSIEIIDQALQQVRDLSLDLRPSLLDDLGLPAALRWYVDRQVQRAGLEAAFNVDTVRERLAPNLETVCFRVVQEAVTNIIRHAHAQRIYVELVRHDEQLLLSIQDDGLGFEVTTARARALSGTSMGLLGMEERVWLSGGELEIESALGKGTTVRAKLPFRTRPYLAVEPVDEVGPQNEKTA